MASPALFRRNIVPGDVGNRLLNTRAPLAGPLVFSTVLFSIAIAVISRSIAAERLQTFYLASTRDSTTYAVTEDGISGRSQFATEDYSWQAFDRAIEAKSLYVLVMRNLACIILPKRNIPHERTDDFATLVRAKLEITSVHGAT
jgi:hypothetical protein